MFQLYDSDGSGSITLSEMVLLFATLYQNEGLDNYMAVERAEKIFCNLDINNDGDITEEEFVRGCLRVTFHSVKITLPKLNRLSSNLFNFILI